jgi:hypothetical protein
MAPVCRRIQSGPETVAAPMRRPDQRIDTRRSAVSSVRPASTRCKERETRSSMKATHAMCDSKSKSTGNSGTQKVAQSGTKWHLFGRSSSPISRPGKDFGHAPDAVGALVGTHCRKPALPRRVLITDLEVSGSRQILEPIVESPASPRSAIGSHRFDPSTLSWMDQSSQPNAITSLSLCPSVPRPR